MDLNDIALDPGGFTGNLKKPTVEKTTLQKAAEFINEYNVHYWIIVFAVLAVAGELGYFAHLRNKLK